MSSVPAPPDVDRPAAGRPDAPRAGGWPAVLVGLVAVGLALGLAELLAALGGWLGVLTGAASPFSALGSAFIAVTPGWLKDGAVSLFGQHDKTALGVSMLVVFVLLAALVGLIGRRSVRAGTALAVVLVVVAAIAVITRPGAGVGDLVPILIGGAVGIAFLRHVLRPREHPSRAADRADGGLDRRGVLRAVGLGAVAAALAGGLSRLVPGVVDVQADRAGVRLPPVGGPAGPAAGGSSTVTGGTVGPAGTGGTVGTGGAGGPGASGAAGAPDAAIRMPPLPAGVNPAVPGLTPYATPDTTFYRVDTAFTLPRVTTDAWRLRVHGLVRNPFEINWSQLLAMPQVQRWITLTCVSNEVGGNLAGNAAWQGVRVADLLARAQPQAGADCVYSSSADGFTVTTPLDVLTDGRDALLAIGMNGQPLPVEHGFPVRMVVPGLYGYVSATKWVVDLEVTRFADATAYWTERGWAPRGPIKTASRIDTPGYDVTVPSGVVPVAGVAWAQHRGIDAVQVQIDDGIWQDATLAGTASKDTWRQWVFRWDTAPVAKGQHTLRCRAVDGTGAVQVAAEAPPAPDGATGYHEVTVYTR